MSRAFIATLLVAALPGFAAASDLADAAQHGNWAKVRTLLASKADVRGTQADGMTALHWAVQANEEAMVAELLQAGADPNAASRYGITPLWLAATNGSASVARLLLNAKADPKATLPHGETALMTAARTGEPETIKVLLAAGSDANAQETSQGESALMWAAAENHGEAIKVLIAGGANPNLHSKPLELAKMDWMQVGMVSTILPRGGWTPAMYAARQDAQQALAALADSGANLDERDPDGATAVQIAIINQHYDAAVLLIGKGANPNVGDNSGMTAQYAAVDMNSFRSDIGRPPRKTMDRATALDVLRVALQHGGDPNARLSKAIIGRHHGFGDGQLGDGATPLMRAAKSNDVDSMQVLLEAGADASAAMANGTTAVMQLAGAPAGPNPAAAEKAIASIQLLVSHGANLNATNGRGETALHQAARAGSNAMVRALVELGADLNAKDTSGKTALDMVMQPGRTRHEDTEALLKELAATRTVQ